MSDRWYGESLEDFVADGIVEVGPHGGFQVADVEDTDGRLSLLGRAIGDALELLRAGEVDAAIGVLDTAATWEYEAALTAASSREERRDV